MQSKEQLERDFFCPKCHHRGGTGQELQIRRSAALMLPLNHGRYYSVSCGLCGYTELYNLAIVVKAAEPVAAPAPLAPEESE